MKRYIILLLIIAFILPCFPAVTLAQSWPSVTYLAGLEMPFRPADKYICEQNPPDFSWTAVKGAEYYDLKVCLDEELTNVKYSRNNITNNFYNFSYPFETGVYYYWSVRYSSDGVLSDWTKGRRFRIDTGATVFTVPDSLEEMTQNVPKSHPRFMFTKETLPSARETIKTGEGKEYYEKIKNDAIYATTQPIEPEPTEGGDLAELYWTLLKGAVPRVTVPMMKCALVYLMEGNKDIGRYGVDLLLALTSWDPNGVTSFTSQDQVHTSISFYLAIGYDWLYDLLTEEEKKTILNMTKIRAQVLADSAVTADVSIKERPYESHVWSQFSNMKNISLATLYELPEAKEWLEIVLLTYCNIFPVYSSEDGGYSQGTSYYSNKSIDDYTLFGVDMTKKAWARNQIYFPLYHFPAGSVGGFGDQSYQPQPDVMLYLLSRMACYYKEDDLTLAGYSKWEQEELGSVDRFKYLEDIFNPILYIENIKDGYDKIEPIPPHELPKGRKFKDIGWASMHSDLVDQNRISLLFKSSHYGSYNHSHADQNAFIINAFGERLAIDSGYYAYGTTWADNYYRQTFAHNGVTVNDGQGQTINDFNAKGQIEEFITHPDFDMVKGNATQAYSGKLEKADRYVLFIRPDIYIVIDDLKGTNKKGTKYEFWLNGMSKSISAYETNDGAKIKKGKATLDAKVQYPEKITTKYSNIFSGADWVEIPTTESYKYSQKQERIWFQTERLPQTKMVTTLDVHKTGDNSQYVKKEIFDKYMVLSFENGSKAYINLTEDKLIEIDGLKFKGVAVVKNDDTYMLVSGNFLELNGKEIINSDRNMSVEVGRNIVNISTFDDGNISIYNDNYKSIKDDKGREVDSKIGVVFNYENNTMNFKVDKGDYTFCLNNTDITPKIEEDGYIDITIDGIEQRVKGTKVTDKKGITTIYTKFNFKENIYDIVDMSEGVNLKNSQNNSSVYLAGNLNITVNNNIMPYIKLKTSDIPIYSHEEIKEPELLKKKSNVLIEAEEFIDFTGAAYLYAGRDFVSNKKCLTRIDTDADSATYKFIIPEDGFYDIATKLTSWIDTTKRQISIDDNNGIFICPYTVGNGNDEGDWTSIRIKTNIYLKKGEHTLKISGLKDRTDFDWFGFIKN